MLLSYFDDIRLSETTASPNGKGITALGLDAAKIVCEREFCFYLQWKWYEFILSLLNIVYGRTCRIEISLMSVSLDSTFYQFCCCFYNALCFSWFETSRSLYLTSVSVLLMLLDTIMSLLQLLATKLILSLYISCNFLSVINDELTFSCCSSVISSSRILLHIDSNAVILYADIVQPFNKFLGSGFSKLYIQAE